MNFLITLEECDKIFDLVRIYLPLQLRLSSESFRGSGQVQLKPPSTFTHSWLQPPLASWHSSISAEWRGKVWAVFTWVSKSDLFCITKVQPIRNKTKSIMTHAALFNVVIRWLDCLSTSWAGQSNCFSFGLSVPIEKHSNIRNRWKIYEIGFKDKSVH